MIAKLGNVKQLHDGIDGIRPLISASSASNQSLTPFSFGAHNHCQT